MMRDFLQFKTFIAQDTFNIFYLVIALILPFLCWFWLSWMIRRYAVIVRLYKKTNRSLILMILVWIINKIKFVRKGLEKDLSWESLDRSQKIKFILVFLGLVFFSELFLRLTFEYLIAFMQMHEWLNPENGMNNH